MAWLAAAGGAASGASAGAAAGAAGAASGAAGAAGAGAAGASGAAASSAGAAGSAAGTGAAESAMGAGSAAEGAAGAAEGVSTAENASAATAGSDALKNSLVEEGKNLAKDTIFNEATKKDESGLNYKPQFKPEAISSDANNKIVTAQFQEHGFKKPDTTTEIGKMAKGLVNQAEEIVSSEDLKTDKANVSSNSPKSSVARFNEAMKNLGTELGAYAKDEGKNLLSNAIASSAQPQSVQPVQPGFSGAQVSSDEKLKTGIEEAGGLVPLFSTIDSYLYKYKPEAQEEYAGTGMVNGDNNLGVMAQELQQNPLTQPAVKTDDKGNLALDTGRLTSINTAMIAELCKKVQAIEEQMYGRS